MLTHTPLLLLFGSHLLFMLVVTTSKLGLGGEYFHEHISDSVAAVHLPQGSYCDKRVRQHVTQMEEMEWEIWCLHEGILIG